LYIHIAIKIYLPKWLRNPIQQESNSEQLARIIQEKIQKKSSISEHEKKKIEQIAEELPDSVIVQEDETQKEEVLTDEIMYELGVAKYGETGKSTMQLTGAISEHSYKLFAALTNNDSPPDESDIY
jgi:hypothetical protein